MSDRAARVLRGVSAAGFAVFVAAFSHVAVGGTAPGIVGLAQGLAFAVLVCVALAGQSLSVLRLSIAVGLSQLVFHLIFSLGAPSGVTAVTSGHHDSMVTFTAASGVGDAVMQGCDWMWAAHTVAAIVTIFALTKGERVIRSLSATACVRLRRLVALPFSEPLAPHKVTVDALELEPDRAKNVWVLLGSMRHRGPPAGRPVIV
ncbi:hypothetical protein [Subtercola boreus]|uniref:Uncharacterized protein n=1 Tax=Subtercola boreus TaxID=120213 RepID=A0A3E0W5P8_9MICO|nr:hypothetical protein [Subtercola boreus]RFA17569.1 hypothetical protein B7R24_17035 [Subtercola boreus]RFA17705.1 hypothetical protein B7R23_16815 [Subtercola boreus]RFA24213.1 hypothetical protein B7R25_17220 [Subtercola boreus]